MILVRLVPKESRVILVRLVPKDLQVLLGQAEHRYLSVLQVVAKFSGANVTMTVMDLRIRIIGNNMAVGAVVHMGINGLALPTT